MLETVQSNKQDADYQIWNSAICSLLFREIQENSFFGGAIPVAMDSVNADVKCFQKLVMFLFEFLKYLL